MQRIGGSITCVSKDAIRPNIGCPKLCPKLDTHRKRVAERHPRIARRDQAHTSPHASGRRIVRAASLTNTELHLQITPFDSMQGLRPVAID